MTLFKLELSSINSKKRQHIFATNRLVDAGCYLSFFIAILYAPLSYSAENTAPKAEFETDFIYGIMDKKTLDIANMLDGEDSMTPGNYLIDISINKEIRDRKEVQFVRNPANGKIIPCLNRNDYLQLGVAESHLTADALKNINCLDITQYIQNAKIDFDSQKLTLNISVPQAYMQPGLRGYVDPKLWDQGINAGFINYQFNTRKNFNQTTADTHSTFVGLQNGINLGAWRLRNESNLTHQENSNIRFSSNRSFIQRDIQPLNSQLSAGDVFSDATLFDSVRLRGVQLQTDENMLPDSQRGFAPVIRGTASTNATVEVRQDNFIIYSINVPPGPFTITNLFPSGSNGDMEITVIEADGSKRTSLQAFSSLPIMVRQGSIKYSLAAGRYRPTSQGSQDLNLATSSWTYGLSDNFTLAAGLQVSSGFSALNLGLGANTRFGALSADITQSRSEAKQVKDQGQSLRLLYSKTLGVTFTNFTLAAYRYSTEGYRTFNDHSLKYSTPENDSRSARSKSRMDLSINQKLGNNEDNYGTLYLSSSLIDYWGSYGKTQSLTTGYGNSLGRVNYDITLTRTQNVANNQQKKNDTQIMLMLSLPLGQSLYAPRVNYYGSHSSQNGNSNTLGMNGYLAENSHLAYSLQAGRNNGGENNGSGNLSYSSPIGIFNAGVSRASNTYAAQLGASGSVVLHSGGVNASQLVGETFGLVDLQQIPNVPISGGNNIKSGWNGYAVVPYLQPYRLNGIGVSSQEELNADIEIEQGIKQVVPNRGAITKTVLASSQGRRVLFQLFDQQHQPIPFGAHIYDEQKQLMGSTDPSGQALLLLAQDSGQLTVSWGEQSCVAHYQLTPRAKDIYFDIQTLTCTKQGY